MSTTEPETCTPAQAAKEYVEHPAIGEPTITIANPGYVLAVEAESRRNAAIAQLREVQKLAQGHKHRADNAEKERDQAIKAFAALKESSAKCDVERIDLRAERDQLLSDLLEERAQSQADAAVAIGRMASEVLGREAMRALSFALKMKVDYEDSEEEVVSKVEQIELRAKDLKVGDSVQVSKTPQAVVTVPREGLYLVAEGEQVEIHLGGGSAILSRSEWDEIVGAL